mgnify:CR=1 FL=1
MTAIAEELDRKMRDWPREKSATVERLVADIIEFAEEDSLDLLRSREVEQEVLDVIDEPEVR